MKRKNNPEDGLAEYLPEERAKTKYEYDPHTDPQLQWAGKAEGTSFEVPIVPLHIHERVTPKSIASLLMRKTDHQLRLFDEEGYPLDKRVDFYHHEIDWANRFVLGDSLIVANSLLNLELLGGKVQMIYVDPPYGIEYNSNFQPTTSSRGVTHGQDDSLTREIEQIKAYRDTWKLGIHSYLAYLRDRLLLCRELLTESGSIFVQISDKNLHHVREVMDEVFGADNFCSVIVFKRTGALERELLPAPYDYILWYAKDKEKAKFRRPLEKKPIDDLSSTGLPWMTAENGKPRSLTENEMSSKDRRKGLEVFLSQPLTSQDYQEGRSFSYNFEGRTYHPSANRHWSYSKEDMDRLVKLGRIFRHGESLRFKSFMTDYPVYRLDNVWEDTALGGYRLEKVYVVQTPSKVIARCILMTTDPGDLVFDPTCGSGTTAFAAEQFGRRWITCETSRIALELARQRLLTATFPYYALAIPDEGIKSGFIYETVPHLTMKALAQGESPATETLYDKPEIDDSVVRVSGPFTVEGIQPPAVEPEKEPSQERESTNEYIRTLVEAIRKSGVVFPGGKRMEIRNLASISSADYIHAEGVGSGGPAQKVAVSFGPRYGALGVRQAETAIRTATANGYWMLVLAGFSFDPGALAFVEKTKLKLEVQFAHINPDMEIHDLLKQTQGSQLFSVLGEPDIEVRHDSSGKNVVELRGVDIYDPSTGKTAQSNAEELAAWFLDEDYDGFSFSISQAFFPSGATKSDAWDKLENALRGSVDKEKMEIFRGTISLPFDEGSHTTIAVKVIDERGNEVIKVHPLSGKK